MAVSFKGAHFPKDIILTGVRWYVAYPLNTRHVEELMLEPSVYVDHSTVNRTWIGIDLMHMIKKQQLVVEEGDAGLTAAEQFYSLAA